MKTLNRRDFLKTSGAAAFFAATPGLAYSQVVGGYGPFTDYKALVCVFLFGGNDSYNMLVPNTTAEYNAYAASRQNLALLQSDLLPITPASSAGADFGLHPAMGAVQQLFQNGSAAFVTNVGPLIEPTTRDEYFNKSVALPPQLFSHNDQQDQWASLRGTVPGKTGWAGRMADLIRDGVAGQQMATNASLFGTNLFQSADQRGVGRHLSSSCRRRRAASSLNSDRRSCASSTPTTTRSTNAVSPTCSGAQSMRPTL